MSHFKKGDCVRFQVIDSPGYLEHGKPRYWCDGDKRECRFDASFEWVENEVVLISESEINIKYDYDGVDFLMNFNNEDRPDLEGWPGIIEKTKPLFVSAPVDVSDLVERVYLNGSSDCIDWARQRFEPVIKRRLRAWPVCTNCGPARIDIEDSPVKDSKPKEVELRPIVRCFCGQGKWSS